MPDLFVHLLSGVRVDRGGVEVPISSRRQRTVVAALALHPGRSVGVDQLVDALWGDEPPDGARATLQTYVSRLRSALGGDAVVHGPAGYRLADGARSDVQEARHLAEEARATLTTDPGATVDHAVRALGLWSGPALADLADDAWFAPAAAGLAELRANLVEVAADGLSATGRAAEAVELLEPEARAQPLREPTQVRLVDALGAAGRAVDAVRAAERYRRRLRDETGLDPGGDLVAAAQRALDAGSAPPARATAAGPRPNVAGGSPPLARGGVLARPSRLIGRQPAVADLAGAVAAHRLVTVCGPGGVGKTRLVAELVASHPDWSGALVVELAPVGPGEVVPTVAATLGLRSERPSAAAVTEHLRGVEGLVVVDNAEHVIGEVRDLARSLVAACPGLRLVVTSRTRLDLPGEAVQVLAPLETGGERPAAVELFVERLGVAGRGGPATTPADEAAVAALCERLDGLPLGLELAAGRAAVLGVANLASRLDAALDLVASSDGARHGGLRRVVEWSYDLLERPLQRLLGALAVLHGEFDLATAEEIGAGVLRQPVSLLVGRLVDASLVATTGVAGRYRLLEMVRQFGLQELDEADGEAARAAHARWAAQRLVDLATAIGPAERSVSAQLDELRAELRGALRWARAPGLVEALVVPLAQAMLYRPDAELLELGLAATAPVLDPASPSPGDHRRVAGAAARLAFLAGDLERAATSVELADAGRDDRPPDVLGQHARGVLELYEGRHDAAAAAFAAVVDDPGAGLTDRLDALGGRSLALCYAGRLDEAALLVAEHRALAEAVDSDTYRAFAAYMEGELSVAAGDVDAAADLLREAANRAWAVGAPFIWGLAATVLAAVLVRHRPPREAQSHLPVLLGRWRATGTWPQIWTALRLVAELLARHGRPDVAFTVLEAADRDPSAPRLAGPDRARDTALRDRLRAELGTATSQGITASASRLDRAAVLDRALAALSQVAVV